MPKSQKNVQLGVHVRANTQSSLAEFEPGHLSDQGGLVEMLPLAYVDI